MCAIFGVWNVRKAAELVAIGLHGNQHRAIDWAGMVSSDGTHFYRERGPGIARQVFFGIAVARPSCLGARSTRKPTALHCKARRWLLCFVRELCLPQLGRAICARC